MSKPGTITHYEEQLASMMNGTYRRPPPRCEVCRKPLAGDRNRCTNGRCGDCHVKWCTPGGNTSPGHGRRYPKNHPAVRQM